MPDIVLYGEDGNSSTNNPAYLILDSESVPDGALLGKVKYADESLQPASSPTTVPISCPLPIRFRWRSASFVWAPT
jgi:hypothetical protein